MIVIKVVVTMIAVKLITLKGYWKQRDKVHVKKKMVLIRNKSNI